MKSPILLSLLLPAIAAAQPSTTPPSPPPACPARDVDLPANLAAWRTPLPATPELHPGEAVQVALHPMAELSGLVPPHAPQAGGAGMAARIGLTVANAGGYEVLLDRSAWIDMVGNGQTLRSTGTGRGPACSTIHKTVAFQLAPGRYTIQLSGTTAEHLRLLVIPR